MGETANVHPLAVLRAELGVSTTQYLRMVDERHQALGFGAMAIRREKVTRWEKGIHAPDQAAQLAMADLHGVPADAVRQLGWPGWVQQAFHADAAVLGAPWTPAGTVVSTAASAQGGPMDRRGFLIATGATLTSLGTDWAGAVTGLPTAAAGAGRKRLTPLLIPRLEQRLDDLRHLDDVLGGGELRSLAVAEFNLLSQLADETVYDSATGQRLFSALAEAARICGWLHFDAGRQAAAQSFYISALRASATAGDRAAGANVLAFMAIQTYSVGNPTDALGLVRTAQTQARRRATPRVLSMLHLRAGRALSKVGDRKGSALELSAARDAYAAGPSDDDPPWSYWISEGEIEMVSASAALELGDPQQALTHFAAARQGTYSTEGYARDNALYLVRAADAHLRLGDVDSACAVAEEALDQSDSVGSARPASALSDFRAQLKPHREVRSAREFLARSA
ncbi:tetratricopeptide (TPR) repeat protein [Kribbella aluminosa]|uniref:Tetratricopeptide (TPR) repeat protein n=1 Tax=Kribbella aluminosa TaxID=416017 RepID=A0ABS4UNU3_9ACTN|nr:hypothetical protein [Kribbella aluminosa]MBP2353300.1 tetratricopeptide (TPR) repeat protein [Kribbella aluminosa]